MKIQLSFEVFDEYLKINLCGGNPFEEIEELLKNFRKLSEENNRKKLLIEAVNITVPSEMQKFYIGTLGVNVFGREIKVAVLAKPEHINKFFENVVVNRGGNLYVAGSEQDALSWLLK